MEPVKRKDAATESAPFDRLVDERYRLNARLGRGRLGIVYEAQDELNRSSGIERRVAVQLLDEDLVAGPGFPEEFTRGAAALHAISHPNIVRVLEHGNDGHRYFLVLELLESASLRFVLDDVAQLPLDEAAPVIRAIGDALQYLHAKRIVHGNLKPENVLVTFGYEVKLLDIVPPEWPAAAQQGDIDDVDYLAPPRPDSRDDVYGLACLAYEMLSGRHPFNANTPEEAYRAELEPAPIPRLPARQWRALVGALELQREHRTPTVAQFLDEFGVTGIEKLRSVVSGAPEPRRAPAPEPVEPAPAPPPPRMNTATLMAERATGYGEPRRAGIGGKLFLLVLLVGLGALAFIYQDRVREEADLVLADIDAKLNERAATTPPAEPATEEPVVAAAPVEDAPIVDATPGAAPPPAAVTPTSVPERADAPAAAPAPAIAASDSTPARAETAPADSGVATPAPAEIPVGPATFSFVQPVATVRESEVAVRIVIRRSGNTGGRAGVAWWTDEGSAIAEQDYADLGRRIEEFAAGERQRTVFVPLANDREQEPTKSFNVYLGRDSGSSAEPLSGMRIDIVDDD